MRKVYYQIKFPELAYFPQELKEKGLRAELIARDKLESLMGLELSRGWKTKIRLQEFSIVCLPDYVDRSRRLIVEVKSVRTIREPAKNWLGQLNLYMFALFYKKGILVQVSDSGVLNITEMSFDEHLAEEAITYFERLNKILKNGELPELPERGKTSCNRFCSFSHICARVD